MKFGISTFVTDEGIAPGALARAVEERGFDSLFIAEHTHIPLSRKSPWPRGGELPRRYYRTLDPFITLTAAAAATERLLLGTGVALVVERDPIITAKEVATLDLVSGGRVIFGVGAGWNREEMENHGTDPRTRGKLTNERIRAMIEIWTKDEPEFHGQYVNFDPIGIWPKPVQKPYPPIYVGGGIRAFERVTQFGDAWLANGLPPGKLERSEEHTSELQSRQYLVCRLLLEKKKKSSTLHPAHCRRIEHIVVIAVLGPVEQSLLVLHSLCLPLEPQPDAPQLELL